MPMVRLRDVLLILTSLAAALAAPHAWAGGMVVVVGPKSGIEHLVKDDVINIFLGRYRQLPNGQAARPVDLPASDPGKAEFYRALVGKDLDQIAAYWSRLVFTGRVSPPLQAASTEELIRFLNNNPGAIGYLYSSDVDKRVKPLLELK